MLFSLVAAVLGLPILTAATSTLLSGGTIISFNSTTSSLNVLRSASLLVTEDRIARIDSSPLPSNLPNDTTILDVSGQIITPGFVDTHRHGWQTAFKTLGSNTTLAEYLFRYGPAQGAASFTAEDVYLGQLTSIYESLNGGVTTLLDHAHHTWSDDAAYTGLNASIHSRGRVFWAYTFSDVPSLNYTIDEQLANFREIASTAPYADSPTELGVSFDGWGPVPDFPVVEKVVSLVKESNISVLTTHCLDGPWGTSNSPSDLHRFSLLNTSLPIVFSHASFLTATDAQLLRKTGQYISITPESEMHYGHTNPRSRYIQDQASLGVDTHFTFSADILTQARLWLQTARYDFFDEVLQRWQIPSRNPMSVEQAFLLATRSGGQALHRDDIGVIQEGAKADIVVWNAKDSISMLGWEDPVAAVMLHASVGDILHVMVDGQFVKRDGKLTDPEYEDVKERFRESVKRIQKIWREKPYPVLEGEWASGFAYGEPEVADVVSGEGNGYGQQHLLS